jgi:hypothetical protein
MFKKLMSLQIATLFVTLLSSSASSPNPIREVPFNGSIEGVEIAAVEFPLLFVNATGWGAASHLGRFTMTYELEVNLLTLPFETSGTAVFTAANGDQLFTDIVGLGTPINEDENSIVELHTITGGTGRFEEATGDFTRTYHLDRITGATSGSFTGVIGKH